MRVSSIKISLMPPLVSDKDLRIESSMFNNYFLSAAFFFTISVFFCYKLGFSTVTICANICSSRPLGVMAKFIIVTLTKVSGE